MLDLSCPLCNNPLFKLRTGDTVCPIHGKVYIVKDEAELTKMQSMNVLDNLEKVIYGNIEAIISNEKISDERLNTLIKLLEVLERLNRLRNPDKVKEEK